MTVRAPHLALVDLPMEAIQARLAIYEVRDRTRLVAYVVEFEHLRIVHPAVDTRRAFEDRAHEGDVPLATRGHPLANALWPAVLRSSSMAARADDVASRDLLVETAQSNAGVCELSDRGRLVSQMVELQYDGIHLAAIDAPVGLEVRENVRLGL